MHLGKTELGTHLRFGSSFFHLIMIQGEKAAAAKLQANTQTNW